MTHVYRALVLVALFGMLPSFAWAYSGYSGNYYSGGGYYGGQVVTTPYWCGTYWSSLPCQQMYYQPTAYYNSYPSQYQNYSNYNNSYWSNTNSRNDYSRDDRDRDRDNDNDRDNSRSNNSRNNHWWHW